MALFSKLKTPQCLDDAWRPFSQYHPRHHAQPHPDREVTLKEVEPLHRRLCRCGREGSFQRSPVKSTFLDAFGPKKLTTAIARHSRFHRMPQRIHQFLKFLDSFWID